MHGETMKCIKQQLVSDRVKSCGM